MVARCPLGRILGSAYSIGYVFLTRLAGERLLHDAALEASSAVASAQRIVNQTAVKAALATNVGKMMDRIHRITGRLSS